RNRERHLAECMRGAAKTWVKGAHYSFDAIQHAFGEFAILDIVLGCLQHALVHGVVVLAGRNHQVRPRNQAVLVHLVVMMQRATGCFCLACSLKTVDSSDSAHMLVKDQRIGEDMFDLLDAVEDVDEARMVVME